MASFIYKAFDNQGMAVNGAVEATDDLMVATNLRHLGYSVVSIQEQTKTKKRLGEIIRKIKRIPAQDIILFSRQLSSMLKSGLSITSALSSISDQIKSEYLKEAIAGVFKDVEAGVTLSEALRKYPYVFDELFTSMIRVGETAGILDQVLDRLSELKTQELDIRTRIRSSLTYPVILVVVAIAVVSFLLIAIIPKFVAIFQTYEARLPISTQILLIISYVFKRAWFFVLIGLAGFTIWLRGYIKGEKGRYKFDYYSLKMPLVGEFFLKITISRFTRTLAALLKSGVPILEALSVTEKTIDNVVIAKVIQNIRFAISQGQSLSEPFRASGIFPQMVIQMISVGEESGRLDQLLTEVASNYERETEYAIKNITVALEPLLLLVMGIIVAFIALSVLVPIFNLIKVFRQGV